MSCRLPLPGSSRGQAAVESAIVLPLAVFVILGLLQMGMIQQARLFADYAAYRGARAASLEMASCDAVMNAELAALVPMLGRADTIETWKTTLREARDRQHWDTAPRGSNPNGAAYPLLANFWSIKKLPAGLRFDTPVKTEDEISHVHLDLYFFYELHIPFANWVIGRLYYAQFGLMAAMSQDVNPLVPINKGFDLPGKTFVTPAELQVKDILDAYAKVNRYVVPVHASWTMRMFSRPDDSRLVVDGSNACR